VSVFVSVLSIIGEITRLEDRPKLFGYALQYLGYLQFYLISHYIVDALAPFLGSLQFLDLSLAVLSRVSALVTFLFGKPDFVDRKIMSLGAGEFQVVLLSDSCPTPISHRCFYINLVSILCSYPNEFLLAKLGDF